VTVLKKCLLGLCVGVSCLTNVYAKEDDDLDQLQSKLTSEWTLVKSDKLRQIKTYARLEDGKHYRSFKATVIMKDTKPEALVRFLLDFDSYHKWYWQVAESKLLKRVSPTEYYVYLVHKAPAGLPDRDVILHATIEPQSQSKNYITLKVQADPRYLPAKPPLVRMIAEDLSFKFTPLEGNDLLVESEGYVDPGGNVPSWAANFVQHSAPYSVTLGSLRMVKKEEYTKSNEPTPFPVYAHNDYISKQVRGLLAQ
jgi:hypothetical protein